jgi:uncharacterized protein (DUF2384 family)
VSTLHGVVAPSERTAVLSAEPIGADLLNHVTTVRTLDDLLRPREVMERVAVVQRGIPARIVDEAAQRFGFTKYEIGSLLGLSKSTLNRLVREDRRLVAVASDVFKDASIVLDGVLAALGGDPRAMNAWLDAHNPSLGCAPRGLLASREGRSLISATINRARYGTHG